MSSRDDSRSKKYVLVVFICFTGWGRVCYVRPGGTGCYACWDRDLSFSAVPENFLSDPLEGKDCLEEDEGEISTCGITGKDDVLRLDGLVP